MKKRRFLIAFLTALLGILCAIGLVACGESGDDSKCEHAYVLRYDNEKHFEKCEKCGNVKNSEPHDLDEANHCKKCDYFANVEQNYKKVTFDFSGGYGDIDSMSFAVGELMTNLPAPQRDGYKFIGWTDVFGAEYTAATLMPNIELSLVAKWEKLITRYEDDFVSFSPASVGSKSGLIQDTYAGDVDKFVYVELTSDDLGGVSKVGADNNFTLRTMESMEYKVKSGYTWAWYQGSFNNPNGAQRFTLNYGSNIQFVTISDSSGVVCQTYLLDIYVKHDYYIKLYKNIFEAEPYDTVRVIENDRFSAATKPFDYKNGFTFDKRVYFNNQTGKYEDFAYFTAIRKDWNLYQTYKPVTLTANTDGGSLAEDLIVTPYTQYFTLPSPEKEDYDFLGWQDKNGKYLTNVQGYSGVNFLSSKNYSGELTAVYAKKKFYYNFENNVLTTKRTVPVITYTDKTMTEILDITYVLYDTDCVLPVKTSQEQGKIFTGWQYYYSDGEFSNALSDFDFNTKITSPVALAPKMESVSGTVVPLNGEITSDEQGTYKMYLPADQTYKLTISATNSVTLTVNKYGSTNNSVTKTVKSGAPQTIDLNYYKYELGETVRSHGFVTFNVTELNGTFTAKFEGVTANTQGNYTALNDQNSAEIGEEVTVTATVTTTGNLGYTFGWFNGNTKLSEGTRIIFSKPFESNEIRAEWKISDEMQNFNFNSTPTTCVITGVKDKTITSLIIPDYVTSIGDSAFNNCNKLTSVIWNAEKCTSAGNDSMPIFEGCTKLRTITFGEKVKTIPSYAFSGCSGLTSVTIPNSVTSIEWCAFQGCSGLTSVIWDAENCTSAGNEDMPIFEGCTKLQTVTFGEKVKTIPSYAFYGCSELTSVTIPNSVTSIEWCAFQGCSGLTSVTIGNGVTSIGFYAFKNCSGLTSVTIGNGVTVIGSYAFENCSGLTSITIPNSVTSIGSSVFYDCSGLTSVTIPNSVTSIGSSAFGGCSGLTSITIPDSVTSIGYQAFSWSGLKSITIPNSVTSIGDRAFLKCSGLTSITIPNSVTSIGNSAFDDCSGLTSITIPDSVTSIGEGAFNGCTSLIYNVYDHAKYLGNQSNPYVALIKVYTSISCTIHENTKVIADYAFEYCSGLTSVTIPDSVTSIGDRAFYHCSELTSITIPDSVTSIGDRAFYGCSGLTSITIPDSVTSIGQYAFYGCSGLTNITFANTSDWKVSQNSSMINSTSLSSSALSTPSTAAQYLKSTYADYYWKRG